LEYCFGRTELSMKANLEMISSVEMVERSMQMENFILVNLSMIRHMDMECFRILMEENMKVNGKMISSMEEEKKSGIMGVRSMMETL
jgi:predicted transcriptional regulator